MSRTRWHIAAGPGRYTLARHWPPRFDVAAETKLPFGCLARLAHQIRQDLWRALQDLRGFSPVVDLRLQEEVVFVRAGGRVNGVVPIGTNTRIAELLVDQTHRRRWSVWAAKGHTL